MLVHGDIDNNVHPANTIRVVDALIRANKRFDMLILPGQRHGFGDMDEYFYWRMVDFFSRWLNGKAEEAGFINQHIRVHQPMNPNAFLKAYSHFEISTTAYAEIPSSRPVNPNFSVVVALIDTSSTSMPITSAKTCCICGI